MTTENSNTEISKIDAAINAAKARKAARLAAKDPNAAESSEKPIVITDDQPDAPKKAAKVKKEKAPKKEKVAPDAEALEAAKAAKKAEREAKRAASKAEADAARAERKANREAAQSAKKAEREAKKSSKKPHMSKVEKAAAKLPKLSAAAQQAVDELSANLSQDQVLAVAAHLQHVVRVRSTERALTQKLVVGTKVRIVGGSAKYVGSEGTVTEARRIRCYVTVEGVDKPIYLFSSDCEAIASSSSEVSVATGTEG